MTPTHDEPTTKTYKEPSSGRVETAVVGSDVEKALIELGYVEIDPETGEVKDQAAADKAAAAKEVKPLNPNAKVHTEADVAAAKAATEAPPETPVMPKPLNEPKESPAVPKKNA
jgi:hypothetical protein